MAKEYLYDDQSFNGAFSGAFEGDYGGSGEFFPVDIDGLVLWLDAADPRIQPDGQNRVALWPDKSEQTVPNNATQSTDSKKPLLITGSEGINGQPTLDFFAGTFTTLEINDANSLDLSSSFTAYAVVAIDNLTGIRTILSKDANAAYKWQIDDGEKSTSVVKDAGTAQTDKSPTSVSANDTTGVPIILELHYEVGGTINFTQNGINLGQPQVNTITAINTNAAKMFIGSSADTGEYFQGSISQVILYDRFLTTAERNVVGSYLGVRYGLPWTNITAEPLDIADLEIWLDAANKVPAGNVSAWSDRTANANNASAVAGKEPVFNATGMGGHPSVDFTTANSDFMTVNDSNSLDLIRDFTFYAVMNRTANTGDEWLFSKGPNAGYEILFTDGATTVVKVIVTDTFGSQTLTSGAFTDATDLILEVHYEVAGTVNITVNGVRLGNPLFSTRTEILANAAKMVIFAKNETPTNELGGKLSQFLLYSRLLTANERNEVGNYLADRVGQSWTNVSTVIKPIELAGIVLWLDGSVGVSATGGRVDEWLDQSGVGSKKAVQTGDDRPLVSVINGQPAVNFPGATQFMDMADDNSLDLPGSFSLFAVISINSFPLNPADSIPFLNKGTNYNWAISEQTVPALGPLPIISAEPSSGNAQTIRSDVGFPTEKPVIIEVNYEVGGANFVKFTVDGRNAGIKSNNLADLKTNIDVLRIGAANPNTSFALNAIVGEIVLFNRLLNRTERNEVGDYLGEKYSIKWNNIPQFAPNRLPGLVLWLDASTIPLGTTDVTSWLDESGNGNNASQSGSKPTLQATGLNGFPSVRFVASSMQDMDIADSATLRLTGPFTVYAVTKADFSGGAIPFFGKTNSNNYECGFTGTGQLAVDLEDANANEFLGLSLITSANDTDAIHEIRFDVSGGADGGITNFTRNGVSLGNVLNTTVASVNTGAQTFFLGSEETSATKTFYDGEIAQLIIYSRLLTRVERNEIGEYLSERYALPWTPIPEFLPEDLAGLALWMDASRDVIVEPSTVIVTSWGDRSPSGLLATTVSGSQPLLSAGGINGRPSISFDGSAKFLEIGGNPTALAFTSSFTAYVVCKVFDTSPTAGTLFAKNSDTDYRFLVTTGSFTSMRASGSNTTSTPGTITNGQSVILEVRISTLASGKVDYTRNGVVMASPNSGITSINTSNSSFFIGIGDSGGLKVDNYDGEIGEIVIYNFLLSTTERNQVGNYLANRYGLSWTNIT